MKKRLLHATAVLLVALGACAPARAQDAADAPRTANAYYEFLVHPNPFTNTTRFRIVPGNQAITHVKVHDLLGKTITQTDIPANAAVLNYTLDFSDVKPGIYFCSVYADGRVVETKRLVKTR